MTFHSFILLSTFGQNAVGWRPEAKRLLLLMTDQPSHLALDSRLGGIVVPHDGRCHLENNVYTGSTRMVRQPNWYYLIRSSLKH